MDDNLTAVPPRKDSVTRPRAPRAVSLHHSASYCLKVLRRKNDMSKIRFVDVTTRHGTLKQFHITCEACKLECFAVPLVGCQQRLRGGGDEQPNRIVGAPVGGEVQGDTPEIVRQRMTVRSDQQQNPNRTAPVIPAGVVQGRKPIEKERLVGDEVLGEHFSTRGDTSNAGPEEKD